MKLQALIAELENLISDFNETYNEVPNLGDKISEKVDEMDTEMSKNEIIIPDELYGRISEFVKYCFEIAKLAFSDPSIINREFKKDFIKRQIDLNDDFREYLGIETLSKENRKIISDKFGN
jgi:hypothetical protein